LPTLLEAALWYAAKGRRVFPVHYPVGGKCSCPKGWDCDSPCKHPMIAHGFKEATSDTGQIRAWWDKWPEANIGVRMGFGIVTLDVDEGGDETLLRHEPIAKTPEVVTPRGGCHLILLEPEVELANAVKRLPGLDLRTGKGYVLWPPSRTLDGVYRWKARLNGQFAPCPAWLIEAFKDAPQARAPAVPPARIVEGERDAVLFKNACRMRYAGLDEDEILVALMVLNKARCHPPLDDAQIRKLAKQAAGFEAGAVEAKAVEVEPDVPKGVKAGTIGELAGEYRVTGLPSGFRFIDENSTTGGLVNGEVAVISAYTGTGKTGALLQIADYAVSQGVSVCYGTFGDTDATGIRNRLLIMRTGWKGQEPPSEPNLREMWLAQKALIERFPLHVWDATKGRGGRRIDAFLEWAERIGPGLLIGDYAQRIRSSRQNARTPMEHAEDACEALAEAGKRWMIPVLLGSQLTLGNQKAGTLDITKGSREWEEAAGFHMKIKVFEEKELEKLDFEFRTISGIAEFAIAKNRFASNWPAKKRTYARWNAERIRFEELA
jgi:hypothetical protein